MVRGTRDLEGRSFDKEAHVSSCPDGNLQIFLQEEQERLQGDDEELGLSVDDDDDDDDV